MTWIVIIVLIVLFIWGFFSATYNPTKEDDEEQMKYLKEWKNKKNIK